MADASGTAMGSNASALIQTILIMIGVVGLIAIVALVLASLAYASLSTRSARRDALIYAASQNTGTGVLVLFQTPLDKLVPSGASETVTALNINSSDYSINPQTQMVVSLTLSKNSSADMAPSGRITFAGNSSPFTFPGSTSTMEANVLFTYAQISSGGTYNVVLDNTGPSDIRVTRARVTTVPRPSASPASTSRGLGKTKSKKTKRRGLFKF